MWKALKITSKIGCENVHFQPICDRIHDDTVQRAEERRNKNTRKRTNVWLSKIRKYVRNFACGIPSRTSSSPASTNNIIRLASIVHATPLSGEYRDFSIPPFRCCNVFHFFRSLSFFPRKSASIAFIFFYFHLALFRRIHTYMPEGNEFLKDETRKIDGSKLEHKSTIIIV